MALQDAWQLKIPIRVCLSNSEITSPVDVKPVYLLAPRYSYLPALAEQCLGLFQHVLLSLPGQAAGSPWFEHQGMPLNWTQPLGVLHDLLSAQLSQAAAAAAAAHQGQQQQAILSVPVSPWCLTVHYRNTPASLSNSWQNAGAAKDYYFSSLKEAGYCCRGSDGCGAVMRLPGQAQDELWAAVNRGDGAAARHIMAQLRLNPTPKAAGSKSLIPVRLYIRMHKAGASSEQDPGSVWKHMYSTSRPVESTQPDGSLTLLAHLAHMVMPRHFPALRQPASTGQQQQQQQQCSSKEGDQQQEEQQHQPSAADALSEPVPAAGGGAAQPVGVEGKEGQHDPGDPLGATPCSSAADDGEQQSCVDPAAPGAESSIAATPQKTDEATAAADSELTTDGASKAVTGVDSSRLPACHELPDDWPAAVVFVCGIQPDWRTPMAWLHANLQAADCFLYVVVHLRES